MAGISAELLNRFVTFVQDPEARTDPYPLYKEIRDIDPVFQTPDGTWWVLSYDGCAALARDKHWSHQNPHLPDVPDEGVGLARRMVGRMVLFRDPPDHTRLRNLLGRIFIMPAAERDRAFYREQIDRVLAEAAAQGEVDFKEQIARIIPMIMICNVLGLPQERYEDLIRWSNSYASMLSVDITPEMMADADREFDEFSEYLKPIIGARRAKPEADLLTEWIAANEKGVLGDDEIGSYVLFTLVGGQATTTTTMTNGLLTLNRHPDQWQRIVENPEGLKKTAADEVLRFESAGRAFVPRWAKVDVELEGKTIPAGSMVIGVESAGNRDPKVFPEPDKFDVGRERNRHLAFGSGIHICPGQFVARVEIQEMIASLAKNYPNLKVGKAGDWLPDWILRGVTGLPVTLDPARVSGPAVAAA